MYMFFGHVRSCKCKLHFDTLIFIKFDLSPFKVMEWWKYIHFSNPGLMPGGWVSLVDSNNHITVVTLLVVGISLL